MRKVLRFPKPMVLVALVLGVMAFGTTIAQAETGAHWNVNGSEFKSELKAELKATGGHYSFLWKVGLAHVEVLCIHLGWVAAAMAISGGLAAIILLESCDAKINGKTAAACVPHSPGAANGTIRTNALRGLIKLHEKKVDLLELVPESGEVLVTLVLGAPEKNECAIGEKFDLTGKMFLKDSQEEGLTEKVSHELETGPLTALKIGANTATVGGKFVVTLAGAHTGMKWSGIAG